MISLFKGCARTIIGVDVNKKLLDDNKIVDKKILADLEDIPLPSESVDIVASEFVIEHLTNPAAVFKEIYKILKPEGVFIFITPNVLSPIMGLSKLMPHGAHKLLRKKLLRKTEEAHHTFYRANTLEKLLKFGNSAGFKHLEIKRAGNPEYLGFIKPLVPLSLFLEKFIDNHFLGMFKMYLIGNFRK